MNVLTIAEHLHKFEYEVLELPPDEFSRWCAYLTIREKEEKRKAFLSKAKSR